jgi:uncharacterized membrane protein
VRRLLGLSAALSVASAAQANAELTLCNRTSYRMDTAIGLEKRANVATRGWFTVDPGQCRQVVDGALDAEMVYLHTRTPPVYGTAPAAQDGNAEFCVREGSFEFADARSCPISQQARFSPTRPSDSPKGPTVNLAEEADYDDAQARLAGIQRLLVIAGYDASPIDGVQGAKTQSAIARFLGDRHLAADAANQPDFFATLLDAARNPEGRGFSWCNDTKYPVMAAIGTLEGTATVTRGWYRVDAGQCLRPDMHGNPAKLYSYGEAVDGSGRAIRNGDTPLSWGGGVTMCTRDGRFDLSDQKDCAARGLNSAGFAEVDLSGKPSVTVRFKEQ